MADHEKGVHGEHSPDNMKDTNIITGQIALEDTSKTTWARLMPAFACGAGLFSDGYLQSVIGPVNAILKQLYPVTYGDSSAVSNVTSIAFAGTVLGQLVFGYTSDAWSRKWTLMVSTVILIVFAALSAGAYGGGTVNGMLAALTAYRFLIGIGIGGEYPAGSVGCAESSGEMKAGTRNRWFILFTNVQIDLGFIAGTLVAMIVVLACGSDHLRAAWRIALGLGVIPPLSLIYFRFKLKEPESFSREKFRTKTPYWLALKFYGPRLAVVCVIWFIYDFLTYPFSIFSSAWLDAIAPDRNLWQNLGWSTLINFFYLPGALLGSWTSDKMGPRLALSVFVAAQGIVGFIMAGTYEYLKMPANVAGFVVVYGIFLSLGEMGPGDNIGLVAAKSCSTGIRGKYYAIAAALGKVGGFVGNYIFPHIIAAGGSETSVKGGQYPFFVASSLCLFSACIVWLLPRIDQDTIEKEDARFRAYLVDHGFDISQMGTQEWADKRRASLAEGEGGVFSPPPYGSSSQKAH